MEEDNFYGQSSIDLSEIKSRMQKTETLIGSLTEIQQFVESGLNKFSSSMTKNMGDDTFKIEVRDPRLTHGMKSEVIARATFDPLRGRGALDLDVIDLGHPLVRNLIELVKEMTFTSMDTYGRTSAIKTSSAKVVSAVYTFLARYAIIKSEPISIVEELLTVGTKIHSGELLGDDEVRSLQNSKPFPDERTHEEIKQDLHLALERKEIEKILWEKAHQRCDTLRIERNSVKKSLMGSVESGEHDWLKGFDVITPASVDLLCVTLYYPIPGGSGK
jgi:hypothetical protein